MNIRYVAKSKIWFTIPIVIILIGIVYMFFAGFNLGIDFAGGTLIYVNIGQNYKADDIREIVSAQDVEAHVLEAGDDKQDVMIRMQVYDNQEEIQDNIVKAIKEKYGLSDDRFTIENVGPTIGRSLIKNALMATLIACVFILGYIWIRFEFKSGVTAVIALVHDVLIMMVVMVVLRVQINSTFVAAVLTIIGYSINNTIVVFDRVRENNKRFGRKMSSAEIVDKSINESITRCVNTSLTTLFCVVALYVLGVEAVKEFTLPILVGIAAGTYSSIFITGPLWAVWNSRLERKNKAAAK